MLHSGQLIKKINISAQQKRKGHFSQEFLFFSVLILFGIHENCRKLIESGIRVKILDAKNALDFLAMKCPVLVAVISWSL